MAERSDHRFERSMFNVRCSMFESQSICLLIVLNCLRLLLNSDRITIDFSKPVCYR